MKPFLIIAAERVDRPQRRLDADRVLVAGQQQRLLRRLRGLQARDEVRLARRRRLDDVDLEAERLEPRAQQLRDRGLVARRVGGVDADELAQQPGHLALPGVLRARALGGEAPQRARGDGDGQQLPVAHSDPSRGRRSGEP